MFRVFANYKIITLKKMKNVFLSSKNAEQQ
jgi:hypothetical protein